MNIGTILYKANVDELKRTLYQIGLRDFEIEMVLSLDIGNSLEYRFDYDEYSTVIIKATCFKKYVRGENWLRTDIVTRGTISFIYEDEYDEEKDVVKKYQFEIIDDEEEDTNPVCFLKEVVNPETEWLFTF